MENLFDTLDEKEQLRISKQVIKELQDENKELLIACKEALTWIGNEENSSYGTFGIMDLLRKALK